MANATLQITGQVTDAAGAVYNFTAIATQDSLADTATITPAVAPPGTLRVFAYNPPVGGVGPFVYATPVAAGIVFTPVSSQPNQWTFTY